MADYYPLIARAVAGAEKNTAEVRRALYERARAALVGQLRGVTPPLSESDITRERLALEEAIRKVEADAVRQARIEATRPAEPPLPPKVERPSRDIFTPAPDTAVAPKPRDIFSSPPDTAAVPKPAAAPKLPSAPSTPPQQRAPDPAHSTERPAERSLLDNALQGFRRGVAADNTASSAPPKPSEPTGRPAPPRIGDAPFPELRGEPRVPRDWHEPPKLDNSASHPTAKFESKPPESTPDTAPKVEMPTSARLDASIGRDEPRIDRAGLASEMGDSAPPPAPPRWPLGTLIAALAVAILIGVVGAVVFAQFGNIRSFVQTAWGPSAPVAPPAKDNGLAPPPKIPDRVAPAGSQQRPGQPPVAQVAQRVVLYEEDPNDPQGKRLVGSAIWRIETISPGPNQPPELVVKADVEVPERRMGVTFSLRRNTDRALEATHTIEIMFKVPPDIGGGEVSNVPGILMKQSEQARGVPLAGLSVKVVNGYFLIALYKVDTERERNIKMLKERSWFDIPIVYANGRRAILAMEKGVPGERAFADAFGAWGE